MTDILTINLPLPVPAIKVFSRWRVFLALFNPRTHFTTCDELRYQVAEETRNQAAYCQKSMKGDLDRALFHLSAEELAPEPLNKSYFWNKQPGRFGPVQVAVTHKGPAAIVDVEILP